MSFLTMLTCLTLAPVLLVPLGVTAERVVVGTPAWANVRAGRRPASERSAG